MVEKQHEMFSNNKLQKELERGRKQAKVMFAS